jgi:hypothetical protein
MLIYNFDRFRFLLVGFDLFDFDLFGLNLFGFDSLLRELAFEELAFKELVCLFVFTRPGGRVTVVSSRSHASCRVWARTHRGVP